jgi:hypothetical protein
MCSEGSNEWRSPWKPSDGDVNCGKENEIDNNFPDCRKLLLGWSRGWRNFAVEIFCEKRKEFEAVFQIWPLPIISIKNWSKIIEFNFELRIQYFVDRRFITVVVINWRWIY